MITDLNCVDCEIHVIKLEVNLTNFTGLWGGIIKLLKKANTMFFFSSLKS